MIRTHILIHRKGVELNVEKFMSIFIGRKGFFNLSFR